MKWHEYKRVNDVPTAKLRKLLNNKATSRQLKCHVYAILLERRLRNK